VYATRQAVDFAQLFVRYVHATSVKVRCARTSQIAVRLARRVSLRAMPAAGARLTRLAFGLFVGGLASALIWLLSGLQIVASNSACPVGLYRSSKPTLSRGGLVVACLPNHAASAGMRLQYLARGDCRSGAQRVAKQIAALPGDVVEVTPTFVAVNGRHLPNSAVLAHDRRGRIVTHIAFGRHVVGAGQVWLMGLHEARSWDSRYFGPVPTHCILGRLFPLVTW
jgi:conjugative transfer signal peptidase TraF